MSLMLRLQIVTWTLTAAMSGVLYWAIWDVVPLPQLYAAVAISIAFLAWSAWATVISRRGLDPASDKPSTWHDHTIRIAWTMNVASAAVFWLLMPFATAETLLFAILLVVTIAVVQASGTLRAPRLGPPGRWARWAPVPLPLVVIVFLLVHPTPLAVPLIAFLATVVVMVVLLRNNMQASLARLHRARREAEEAKEARTRFLAAASHDLRQPLQAARLFVGQAQRTEAGEARERMLRNATSALEAIDRLAEQSLDHLRADFEPVALGPVALGPAICDARRQFAASSDPEGVRIRAVNSNLAVLADAELIARALGNLLDNALKHARANRILVGVKLYGRHVRLYVIDDGRGLGVGAATELFRPFVQGPDAGEGERGGFGLGLANVRRFAEAMGGTAAHDPRWRQGAAFYIEFSLA